MLLYHYMHFAMSGTDHSRYTHYLALQPARWLLAPFYDYGFYAVQLFWIISGFVFAAVYFDRAVTGRAFAANRFARLYPLHLLTLLVVALELAEPNEDVEVLRADALENDVGHRLIVAPERRTGLPALAKMVHPRREARPWRRPSPWTPSCGPRRRA